MAKTGIVTGFAQIDAILGSMEVRTQKKLARKALRKCGKLVADKAKEIVTREAHNTGTLAKSFSVRAMKRSRKRIGVSVMPPRDKLLRRYEAVYGHPPHPAKGEKEPFYYPASIEFGYLRPDGTEVPAIRPMRRALYDNAAQIRKLFEVDMKELVNEAGKK